MRITADTNILARTLTEDDPHQARDAKALLERASLIAIPVGVFCELCWLLRSGYRFNRGDIADAIEALLESETVVTDRPAVESGIRTLRAGGDFADGAFAVEGAAMGGDVFTSFDLQAVALHRRNGVPAETPSDLLSRSG